MSIGSRDDVGSDHASPWIPPAVPRRRPGSRSRSSLSAPVEPGCRPASSLDVSIGRSMPNGIDVRTVGEQGHDVDVGRVVVTGDVLVGGPRPVYSPALPLTCAGNAPAAAASCARELADRGERHEFGPVRCRRIARRERPQPDRPAVRNDRHRRPRRRGGQRNLAERRVRCIRPSTLTRRSRRAGWTAEPRRPRAGRLRRLGRQPARTPP